MELCTYAAPASITGLARIFSFDRTFMAAGGCLVRVCIFGRCVEVWGPEPNS